MNNVINFDFNKNNLRVIEMDGQPWFVAADVCRMLGLYMSGDKVLVSNIGKFIGDAERRKEKIFPSTGGNPYTVLISESGLYKLIMRSSKPEARAFQDWVTKVVLPAIRKDGGYIAGEEKVVTGEMSEDEFIYRAMQMQEAKIKRLKEERDQAAAERDQAITERDGLATTVGKREHTIARFVRTIPDINCTKVKSDLLNLRYFYKKGGTYRVYRHFSEFFVEKINEAYGSIDIYPTEKGKTLLTALAKEGKLTKLKNAA